MRRDLKIYIETYGCSANQAHSETMQGALLDNGFGIAKTPDKADVIVINTCIVKTPTENKIRDRLKFLVKQYPGKTLVIAGCAADVGTFRAVAPHALFLSSHRPDKIAKLLLKQAKASPRKIRRNPLVGITEISSGCLGNCAYCIVKLARGKLKSRPVDDIAKDVNDAVKDGCREIWLTSQDNSCYGLDIGTDLAKLIRRMTEIKGDFRIRIGMMNPSHLKPIMKDLIAAYKDPKVYKFVHIPVQSGSDRILKLMNRGYGVKDFEAIATEFRSSFPRVTLSTDVIVGFPGESEQDFRKTLVLIGRLKPDIVNISKFGARPGTEAARMKRLDDNIVKERSKRIAALVKKIGAEKGKKWVGRRCEILIIERGKRKGQFMGRNEFYRPVIIESERDMTGKFLSVKITKCGQTFLAAKINRNSERNR